MPMREVVRKLRAYEKGQALPRFSTKHVGYSKDPIHVAFVRLSGETRPWAVGWIIDGKRNFSFAVDGRRFDQVREMLHDFADDLLQYFRVAGVTWDAIDLDNLPDLGEHPQLWLPAASHLDMLHYLSYAYWRSVLTDDNKDDMTAFARLCGHLFRESSYPGQQLVCDAARVLRDLYVFPADDSSLGNVNAALTWIGPGESFEDRVKSARASSAHGLGISLDADVENPLHDLFDAHKEKPVRNFETRIGEVLEQEINLRLDASLAAYEIATSDPRKTNAGAEVLLKDSLGRYWFDFQRAERKLSESNGEPVFTPHPETDHHGSAAASKFYQLNAANNKLLPTLIHDDRELLLESISEGRSVKGRIVQVKVEGTRSKTISWVIEAIASDEFRLSESDNLVPIGSSGHNMKPRLIEFIDDTVVRIELEFMGRKTIAIETGLRLKPENESWTGEQIVLVPSDSSGMDVTASQGVWKSKSGIGAWLTHSKPVKSPDPAVLTDVSQIEGGVDL
jgi:hypothetical protein